MAAILKNHYDLITPPPIVRLLRNLVSRRQMTCWWRNTGQNRNRK